MAIIPIRDVPGVPVQPAGDELILIDNGIQMQKATINDAVTPKATEIADDKIADLNLGTASQANVEDFATAAQGLLADSAVQPTREIIAGTGLTGGGNLSADRTISLDSASIASLAKADTAVQSVVAGANVTVDATDPQNPIISASGGGAASTDFATVADLLADDNDKIGYVGSGADTEVLSGEIITAQGFHYEVAASDATDAHVETAGGVKLYVCFDRDILDLAALGFPTSDPDENNSIFSLGCRISKRLWFSDTGNAIPIKTIRIDRDLSLYSDGGTLDGIITNLSSEGDVLATGLKVRIRGVYFKPTAVGVGSSPWPKVIRLKHFDFFSHKGGGIDGGECSLEHDDPPAAIGVWEPHELQNGRIFITRNEYTGDAAANENPLAVRHVVLAMGYKYLKIADNDIRVTNIYEVFKTTTSGLETHIKDNFVEASVGEEIWDAFQPRGPVWCSGNHWISKRVITTNGPVGGLAVITKPGDPPPGVPGFNRAVRGPFYINFTGNVFETDGSNIAILQGHYSMNALPDGSYPTQVLIWKDNRVEATCRANGGAVLSIRGYSDVSVDGGVISYEGDFDVMWGLHFTGCKRIDVSGTRITRGSVSFTIANDTTGQTYGSNEIASVSKVTLDDARFGGAFYFFQNTSLIATIDDCDITVQHTQTTETRPWFVNGGLAQLKVTDCRFTVESGASGGLAPIGRALVTDLVEERNTWTPDKGDTASRPTGTPAAGTVYFDTDLGKPIWWDGSAWVDATGTGV